MKKQVIPYCLLTVLLLICSAAICQTPLKQPNGFVIDTLRKPAKHKQVADVPMDTFVPCDIPLCICDSSLSAIQFKTNVILTKEAQAVLIRVAEKIKKMPGCNVKIIGHIGSSDSKVNRQLSYNRVAAIISHLVKKQGVHESKLIFCYGEAGNINTVDLEFSKESGPNALPPPQ